MSVAIKFENIVKKYGDLTIIPDLSMEIKEGEFFTLLGPSGCGKTTLLRMIAGFNSIEAGTISFNGKPINNLDPSKRNIGMVFQSYAIFPHMSVKKNVEFGLSNRKVDKAEASRRADEMLKTVKIAEYAQRMPDRLSGGQQQRVALARAIVIKPDVLLMDEPLSNLDAKLRVDMRSAIREIQNSINITTVYVTHDQEEAMAVSDRIAVMKDGLIQHIGTPQNIYQRPANIFVATFIGHTNIINAKLEQHDGQSAVRVGGYTAVLDNLEEEAKQYIGKTVKISARPEELKIVKEGGIKGKIISSVFLGINTHYNIEIETGETVEIVQTSEMETLLKRGEQVRLTLETHRINVYNESGPRNLIKGVKNDADKR